MSLPHQIVRLSTAVASGIAASPALAHVGLNTPNGGEQLTVGSVVTIEWYVVIAHDTQDWDLWYSTTGIDGPWTEIAVDLPAGDISMDAVHTFAWTVPDEVSDQVRVRVRMDNEGAVDYYDISDGDLSIVTSACIADWNADGTVNTFDFVAYLNDYNDVRNGGGYTWNDPDLAAPIGDLNTADFLSYLNAYVSGC